MQRHMQQALTCAAESTSNQYRLTIRNLVVHSLSEFGKIGKKKGCILASSLNIENEEVSLNLPPKAFE
jgi:hypothetical protein